MSATSALFRLGGPTATSYGPADRGRLVFWGLLGSAPFGGMTWQVLHYIRSARRLGFDVWYVEDSDANVYDPATFCRTDDSTANVAHLAKWMDICGLGDRWIFRRPRSLECLGARDLKGLEQLYRESDAVVNLCGAQDLLPHHRAASCLVYVETDPVEKQVAVANGEQGVIEELDSYNALFTYGENIGTPGCVVPVVRYQWQSTRPPVCLDWWRPEGSPPAGACLTTIANWRHEGKVVTWQGQSWRWSKDEQFRRFFRLPERAAIGLEIAVGAIGDDDVARLREHRWRVVESAQLADPAVYRSYIRASLGEFTVAKEQYVAPRSGWFSDRSACYLASGRPVVTQDTGFGDVLPTGEGLFAFTSEAEAVEAIGSIASDYERHASAAYEIAREYFDGDRVVGELLSRVGVM
jgi:hypothetical protein